MLLLWCILIVIFVCFLLDFDYVFFFRGALWPSAGKELTSWLSTCSVFLNVLLVVCFPFPFGVCGRMWNSIASVPDNCLFVYFPFFASTEIFRKRNIICVITLTKYIKTVPH